MKKLFVEPAVEVVSFFAQERLMLEGYYDDNAEIGDVTPTESGAGGSDGWTDF